MVKGLPADVYRRSCFRRAVIRWIKACFIRHTINMQPVRAIDSTFVPGCRTDRVCRNQPNPTILLERYGPHFIRDFRQILVLGKDNSHVEITLSGVTDNIKREPDIDALFLGNGKRGCLAVGTNEGLVAIPKRPLKSPDSASTHGGELRDPECIPGSVVQSVWNPCVEVVTRQLASAGQTCPAGQPCRVKIRPRITESFLG